MSEKDFWKTLKKGMRGKWAAQRHEDAYQEGIPDVSYDIPDMRGSGWIELKFLKAFPKRESTIVKIPHYTKGQRLWIKTHGCLNNRTFLFAQVGRDFFLFKWLQAVKYVGILYKKEDFYIRSFGHWENHIDYRELSILLS